MAKRHRLPYDARATTNFGVTSMATVYDVAAHVLKARGVMSAMKLQKLVYYCQALSLAWDGKAIFPERVEAWARGPVIPELYREHRLQYELKPGAFPTGNPDALTQSERKVVDDVLSALGEKTAQWLSDLSHSEKPWRDARVGMSENERGNRIIEPAAMQAFYAAAVR
jgi:uncharacterized phage-associated protein